MYRIRNQKYTTDLEYVEDKAYNDGTYEMPFHKMEMTMDEADDLADQAMRVNNTFMSSFELTNAN